MGIALYETYFTCCSSTAAKATANKADSFGMFTEIAVTIACRGLEDYRRSKEEEWRRRVIAVS
jgi:hypothetical protein